MCATPEWVSSADRWTATGPLAQPSGASRWNGPYLRKNIIPKDPWGNDYQYRQPGQSSGGAFDLYSLGADNAEGGDGENQDVVSWM